VKIPDGKLSMHGWLQAMKNGHVFMSNGPLVELEVDGQIPGQTVDLSSGDDVTITVEATSLTPLEKAELVFNGEVVADMPLSVDRRSVSFERDFRPTHSGWYHVRLNGAGGEAFPMGIGYVQAVTNPVWIIMDGAPIRSSEAADYGIAWIDKLQEMAEEWPDWRSQAEKDHVYAQFDSARDVYRQLKAEAGGN
jgi:hypothetical protein